jgi:hypothetical protein
MQTPEFVPFPKIGRWANNKITITEKIDGTNASIWIGDFGHQDDPTRLYAFEYNDDLGRTFNGGVRAGSRNRFLTREADNYGFAKWVQENAAELVRLGPGTHYGEFWGSGIQRGYGLQPGDKRFSLFNVGRWIGHPDTFGVYDRGDTRPDKTIIMAPGLGVVPTLHYGAMRDNAGQCQIEQTMRRLQFAGSQASPGFKGEGKAGPEGCMVCFEALKTYSKVPFDGLPKGLAL